MVSAAPAEVALHRAEFAEHVLQPAEQRVVGGGGADASEDGGALLGRDQAQALEAAVGVRQAVAG